MDTPQRCDGTACVKENQCNVGKGGMSCTLPKGHLGPHIACGAATHNYKVWDNTDAPAPQPAPQPLIDSRDIAMWLKLIELVDWAVKTEMVCTAQAVLKILREDFESLKKL